MAQCCTWPNAIGHQYVAQCCASGINMTQFGSIVCIMHQHGLVLCIMHQNYGSILCTMAQFCASMAQCCASGTNMAQCCA